MSVLTGTAYVLVHTPDILCHHGSTQVMERLRDPASPHQAQLKTHLRGYQAALEYMPHQAFIGGFDLDSLGQTPRPWYAKPLAGGQRFGPYGEIMPEPEFYGMLKLADSFNLVSLEERFSEEVGEALAVHPHMSQPLLRRLGKGRPMQELLSLVADEHIAVGLYLGERLVGCVQRAHENDPNLSAHIMLENLATKASAALSVLHLLKNSGRAASEVDYIIECSEEACGDINQRGGGSLAKAVGEMAALINATGVDLRGFCAGPVHALLQAGALVDAGIFRTVLVTGGASVAKLGMNSKEHVAKGLPVLEDMLGAFALLVSRDDGVNPVLRLDALGKLTIGIGSSPQHVMKALVSEPLLKLGYKISDVDWYCAELHNPDITEAAGAGNVPESNTRMIAALAVMAGEFDRADIASFVARHGLPGFAPTQGHVPSGVPALGHMRDRMLAGTLRNALLIGKGSLFLGRLTNLFDGLSMLIEQNPAHVRQARVPMSVQNTESLAVGGTQGAPAAGQRLRVLVPLLGSEHGSAEVLAGAQAAQAERPDIEVMLLGPSAGASSLPLAFARDEEECRRVMDRMLADGQAQAAIAMHHCFPLGVSTVGLVTTPARGKPLFIACTTGMSAPQRVAAMICNAVYGVSAAKAWGLHNPSVGVLNIEGARATERHLQTLVAHGYPLRLIRSGRLDTETVLRGNDVLGGVPDVLVCDNLTGNLLMKMLSAFTTGGNYESVGWGYGPGVGGNGPGVINIVSRASGAPVINGAIHYAVAMVRGNLHDVTRNELVLVRKAGFESLDVPAAQNPLDCSSGHAPAWKPVSEQIAGIDVMELEEAQRLLWAAGLYAETGMGCVGPVLLLAPEDISHARQLLLEKKMLNP